jgi:apolipoprotein D and lipocalin family protein
MRGLTGNHVSGFKAQKIMTLPEGMAGSVTGPMIEQYRQRNLRNCLIVIVTVIIGWMATAITPALAQAPTLPTVTALDLQHYAGKWYEIARLPMWFERHCINDVSATYTLKADQAISVLNTCRTSEGMISAQGIAVVPHAQYPGQLRVRFAPAWLSFLPFVWGDYWVIDLAPDYSWALVGAPSRKYLWILSRTPTLEAATTTYLKDKSRSLGFDADNMIDVENARN